MFFLLWFTVFVYVCVFCTLNFEPNHMIHSFLGRHFSVLHFIIRKQYTINIFLYNTVYTLNNSDVPFIKHDKSYEEILLIVIAYI